MNATIALFQPAAGGQTTLYSTIVMYLLIFAIFYFVLWRPQQTQRKQHEAQIRNVKKGDKIVTAGGIIGEIVFMKDNEITIRSGEAKLVIDRDRIARVVNPTPAASTTDTTS